MPNTPNGPDGSKDVVDNGKILDIVNGTAQVAEGEVALEFGEPIGTFTVVSDGSGKYHIEYEGHDGRIGQFHEDDFDRGIGLMTHLMKVESKARELEKEDDMRELVEWAGKIKTVNKERAEEEPELYVYDDDLE